MIPSNFQYKTAKSVDEAIALLKQHNGDAKLLAGGHSLLPAMKLRLNMPGALIDIGRIPELRFIREEGSELVIGAASTHHDISRSELLKRHLPIMNDAAELIGDVQVRNAGTLGGSIAHADPAADWPAVLLAAEAVIVARGPKGERRIAAADFFTGFFSTALADDEVITQIRLPKPPAGTGMSYQKFMQPASRFAIVGCAALVTKSGSTAQRVRVAFTGASDGPFRDTALENALQGKALNADNIKAAADQAAASVDIMSDHFASEEYRRHLAKVYAKRALTQAAG